MSTQTANRIMVAGRFLLLCTAIFLIAFGFQAASIGASSQQPGNSSSFEVFSLKPTGVLEFLPPDSSGRRFWSLRPFNYTANSVTANKTLAGLIEEAYSVEDWQISGPEWTNTLTYELWAKFPNGTDRAQARLMLRAALEESFHLELHRDIQPTNVIALEPGQRGLLLKPVAGDSPHYSKISKGHFEGTGSWYDFATYFRSFSDLPVIDLVQAPGTFHIAFDWVPEDLGGVRYNPPFWTALAHTSGLRAQRKKIPFEVLVVDHADKVPENQ